MKILDKGFVKLVDCMGDDSSIVQAARVSYSNGTKTKRDDDKLINYLLKNKHWTPFEMVVFKFHIKLPIFIARQWMRHRAGSFNEISGRYSVMKDDFYFPNLSRIQAQSIKNKQCSGDELDLTTQKQSVDKIRIACVNTYKTYQDLLDSGVSREIARIVLPNNLYTEFYWKVDLRNLFNFIALRSDDHAQWEIQQYSNAIATFVKEVAPVAYQSFLNQKK